MQQTGRGNPRRLLAAEQSALLGQDLVAGAAALLMKANLLVTLRTAAKTVSLDALDSRSPLHLRASCREWLAVYSKHDRSKAAARQRGVSRRLHVGFLISLAFEQPVESRGQLRVVRMIVGVEAADRKAHGKACKLLMLAQRAHLGRCRLE